MRIYTRVELQAKLARAGLTALWHHHAHGLHSPYWWLKCAVGVHNDKHRLTSAYHRMLVWDIMRGPAVTRLAEQALNPLIGKSLVVYAREGGRLGGRMAEGQQIIGEALERGDVLATGESIARVQDRSGAIAWPDGHVDAWDHVECAMALSACGLREPARRAYRWLRETQRADGSWARSVESGRVTDPAAESHHAAYVAVGAWHEYLVTGDERHALTMWPTVRRAVDWALGLGTTRGEVLWERDAAGRAGDVRAAVRVREHPPEPALRGGAGRAGRRPAAGLGARGGPARARWCARHPEAFADKSRFSMDWYYPVLGGAVRGAGRGPPAGGGVGRRSWFPGSASGASATSPWVTGGRDLRAGARAGRARDARPGARGCSRACSTCATRTAPTGPAGSSPTRRRCPRERSTWTAAAVVLAADALAGFSGGAGIFRDAARRGGASPGTGPRAAASRRAAPREPNGPGGQPMPSPVRSSRRSEPSPGISVNAPDSSARW